MFKKLLTIPVVIVISIITLGILATQTIAPEGSKPSTIIYNLLKPSSPKNVETYKSSSSNSTNKKDNPQSISPDDKNYVAKLDFCDLGLKFPKEVEGKPVEFIRVERASSADYYLSNFFSISCFKEGTFNEQSQIAYNQVIQSSSNQKVSLQDLSTDQLKVKFGWFIAAANLKDIKHYVIENNDLSTIKTSEIIRFKYNNLNYQVSSYSQTSNLILPPQAIQLQFNSLVANTDSSALKLTTGQSCEDRLDITIDKNKAESRVHQYPNNKSEFIITQILSGDNPKSIYIYCSKQNIASSTDWDNYVYSSTNLKPIKSSFSDLTFLDDQSKSKVNQGFISVQKDSSNSTNVYLFADSEGFVYQVSAEEGAISGFGLGVRIR